MIGSDRRRRGPAALRDSTVRILLVRDDSTPAHRWQRALPSQGLCAEVAASPQAVVDALHANRYDLLILEVPDRVGFRICRSVRAAGLTVPMLLLAPRVSAGSHVNGTEAVGDDDLTGQLAFLRHNGGPSSHGIVVGGLTLDPITRRVYRDRRRIDLTSKEFALLEYLMRHAGEPLRRSAIAEHVWGVRWDRRTNVIDVFISHLRKKLHAPGDRPVIYSVRGVGYLVAGDRPAATLRRPVEAHPCHD
jgi:two-component system OmpR family response regulator